MPFPSGFTGDVRHAWRSMTRAPGLFAAGVLALGVGIGGPTIMYGILAGMLSALPVADSHEVVDVSLLNPSRGTPVAISADVLAEWTRSATSFETLGAYSVDEASVDGPGASPQRYPSAYVTAGVFEILEVSPVTGRAFAEADVRAGATPVAVIREDVWEERFNRSPDALGSILRINGVRHTIIGVVPSGFGFPINQRLWMALPSGDRARVSVLGRLKDGVSAEAASSELQVLLRGAGVVQNAGQPGIVAVVDEYVRVQSGEESRTLARYLYLVVAFLVFVAALNVAGLLLARGSARSADVALRLALGGSRLRVMGQVLLEALMLAAGGTVLGLLIAQVALDWIGATLEARGSLRYWARFEVHGSLIVFATLLMGVATLVAGLVPALRTTRIDLSQAIKPGAASLKGGMGRTLPFLVGVEVALSCALLLLSALIVKGAVAQAQSTDSFPSRDVLTARFVLEDYDYPDEAARARFRTELTRRFSSSPEVRDFTLTTTLPGDGAPAIAFRLASAASQDERDVPRVQQRRVLPSFFPMFGLQLVDGRLLTDADAAGSRPAAVVNEAFARTQLADGAVGRQLRLGTEGNTVVVVGVVSDPGVTVDDGRRAPSIFLPLAQGTPEALMIAMRTQAGPAGALAVLVREVAEVDPLLPLGRVRTLEDVIRRGNDGVRIFGTLFSAFGAASLMLAVVGLHGLVAFAVLRRRREIGIMRALGATSGGVIRSTLANGLAPVAVGLVLGVGVAFVMAPLLGEGLFGTDPHDPVVFVLVPLGLIAAAAFAALGPARRAIRLDPIQALRAE